MEMAFLDVAGALACDRRPCSRVPQHDGAAAILVLGDDPLERGIAHRMVFGADREALVVGIGARPLGHRPALEHAVDFDPEIVMQPRGIMLLDDEAPSVFGALGLGLGDLASRLGGQRKVALGIILGERTRLAHGV